MGCAGHPVVRTPHLDKLAASGLRFSNAHADCPVCIPQRTTWITGIKSHNYGKPEYAASFRVGRTARQMLGGLMTGAGFQTGLIGKTHWHTEESFRGGFETVIRETRLAVEIERRLGRPGATFSGIGFNALNPGPTHVPPQLYSTDWIVDQGLDFLEHRDRTQPFFLWLSFTDPHPPNTIHEPYYSMYDSCQIPPTLHGDWAESDREPFTLRAQRESFNYPRMGESELGKARAVYYGKVTNLDHQIGRILGKLQADKLFEETWIFYTSDHGELLGDHGLFSKRCFLNASSQVPLILRPPASINAGPGRVTEALVMLDDLLPTFCDLAGADVPQGVTGKSWLPLIRGDSQPPHSVQHGQIANNHLLHDGRFKYLYFADDGAELVFDCLNDPNDLRDLALLDRDLTTRLRGVLVEHLEQEKHPHVQDGELVVLRTPQPGLEKLRARISHGWGAVGEGRWPV